MRFSIVIPVYNSEKYIHESVDSVINQTYNFKQFVEVILVDDGSTDRSQEICKSYVNQYPDNIKYVYQVNAGPGNARNTGIDSVSNDTDFIGFLDADDRISPNTLEKVATFFKENTKIQLAVIPLHHFERIDTPQRLNYRFNKGNRVISILEEYNGIHFYIGGCFFNAKQLINNPENRFQTNLRFWEDALFINTFLLEHTQYGVVSEAKYYYRQHFHGNSLVDSAWYQKSRYTDMIHCCYWSLINESKSRYGAVIPYVQFLLIYHLRSYLFAETNPIIYEVLSEQEQEEFFHELLGLLNEFEDKYIEEQDIPFFYKNYLLNLKRNGWPYKASIENLSEQSVKITKCRFLGFHWRVRGHYKNTVYFMKPNDRLFIQYGEDKIKYLPKVHLPGKLRMIWGTVVRNYEHAGFKVFLPFYRYKFQFGLEMEDGRKFLLNKVNLKERT